MPRTGFKAVLFLLPSCAVACLSVVACGAAHRETQRTVTLGNARSIAVVLRLQPEHASQTDRLMNAAVRALRDYTS